MKRFLLGLSYERQVLIVYIGAIAMTVIDGTMLNVALPAIAGDFGIEANEAEWVAIGYLLAVAAVIPAAGWLGDRFGTRRMFLLALSAFVGISLLCGLAGSLEQLIAARVLQGLGGGLILPVGSAMLFRAFPLHRRAVAASAVLSVAVLAPATGPLLGGVLVDQASWRWIFYINVPIGAIVLVIGRWVLREERHESPGRLDLPGLLLTSAGVAMLLGAVSLGPEEGWGSGLVVGLFVVGAITLASAIATELRVPEPALALRLFRDRLFRDMNLSASFIYMSFFGLIFVLPIYMQTLRGETATSSGLVQVPQAIGILIVSNLFGQRAYRAIGPRRLMGVGGFAAAVFTMAFGLLGLTTSLWTVGALSFGRGLSIGLVFISIQTGIYATTELPDMARATSLFNTQRQISSAVGTAVGATVITAVLAGVADDAAGAERLGAYRWGFFVVGMLMLPGAVLAWRLRDEDVAATRQRAATVT